MGAQTTTTTQAAKKVHRCSWCWQLIPIGEIYKRYRFYDGGDAGTVKMHPECHDAMCTEASEEGGYIEWTPGDQGRPPKLQEEKV